MEFASQLSLNPNYKVIRWEEALSLTDCRHAAHCCIYSLNPRPQMVIHERYPTKAAVLMQPRFDGRIGFPGGMGKKGEDVLSMLNRELNEEINLDLERFAVTGNGHVISHKCITSPICNHFFKLEVSMDDFELIERETFKAREYGNETFGTLRVPLFTMEDGFRGLPAFLCNTFAGNAGDQLLIFLASTKIMTVEELLGAASWNKKLPRY